MSSVTFHFHGAVQHLLPARKRKTSLVCAFEGKPSVKHLIESLGIPHTQLDHITANKQPVDLSYLVQDGDHIEVFSQGRHPNRPDDGEARFILDTHLGKLAVYLRMCGFDTLYRNDYGDQELAQIASGEGRILLSRDRGLLKRKAIALGHCVIQDDPLEQLVDVLFRFDLFGAVRPFRRCLRCNTLLLPIDKERVQERLPANTRQYYNEFCICPACDQIYWKGSHYQRMQRFIERVMQRRPGQAD